MTVIIQIPGTTNIHIIAYFTASAEAQRALSVASPSRRNGWQKCLQSFWAGNKDYCDARFKLIPNFVSMPLLPVLITSININICEGGGFVGCALSGGSKTRSDRKEAYAR
jgi:hypothetical protein